MNCQNCNEYHDGSYASGRFCNVKCSRGYATKEKRAEINAKVSNTLTGKKFHRKHKGKGPRRTKFCIVCGSLFEVTPSKYHQKCCSYECGYRYGGQQSALTQGETRRSKNEKYFYDLCVEKFGVVLSNVTMFNGWDADIIIPEKKIAICWNGKWHYEKITRKHSVLQVQNRDKIKINEIQKCGYVPYVIKDMGSYNKEFVEKEFEKFNARMDELEISPTS